MHADQISFADLGVPLSDVTFVVVDLETTGGAPADAGITEIGAVKVRGGQTLGDFQTLVNPGVPIPPFVASLTGITDATVANAPRLAGVLPAFLEFAHDCVLVAHNAPYDIGFLKGACAMLDQTWPDPIVLDTARIARVALHRDEVLNCKLATLAAHFRASVTPTHRALDDARATADVLHGLIERVGNLGVSTLDDLRAFSSRVSTAQRTKRHLADGLPDTPGVYVFQDAKGEALYVGTSRRIRTRVRSYFTASEQRRRMAEMIRIAERVVPIPCATVLEARIRELRLIASEQPRYNRMSRRPDAQPWLKLTVEPAPRLSIVRSVSDDIDDGARYLGPFSSRDSADQAAQALQLAFGLRTCTTRLAQNPRSESAGCVLHELGKCHAPCKRDGDRDAYDAVVMQARAAMSGDLTAVISTVMSRIDELASQERYEDAAAWRERLGHLANASLRTHRLASIAQVPEIVAARPTADNGWDIHVIRYGRLAAATTVAPGLDPRPHVESVVAIADAVSPSVGPRPAGLVEEATEILAWLGGDGTRLVHTDVPLSLPRNCGGHTVLRLGEVRRTRVELSTDELGASARRPMGPVAGSITRIRTA